MFRTYICCSVVVVGRLRWNEWYVATHAAVVETPGQVIAGSREDAELQDRSTFLFTAAPVARATSGGWGYFLLWWKLTKPMR
jgi:hypothetical protein